MCHRPASPGEAFHSAEHPRHSDPSAPPNSPTGIPSLQQQRSPNSSPPPHLSSSNSTVPPSLPSHTVTPKAPASPRIHRGPHLPGSSPSLLKGNPPPPPLSACNHPCNGHCSGGNVLHGGSMPGTTSTRDTTCRGHKFSNSSGCSALQHCEADEGLGEDEDSSSEPSSCTSSSNQRDGKFCDCCYCEFFGNNTPAPAPTSRNYSEMREKLRSRLTKRKEEIPQKRHAGVEQAKDQRNVEELLDFINNAEPKATNSSKAAKRARHKLKKKEKALQDVCAEKTSDDCPSSVEETGAPAAGEKLLQWPQLELERVNSFLTSRLEEIKNTIKDSIRASFKVYDLNLDVNDFPKKAAVLEQKNLLSHLNGSSDLQEIDLDLSPLSLGAPKSQGVQQSEDLVSTVAQSTENGVVKRLSAVPNLSRMIWVQSPKASETEQSVDVMSTGTKPDTKDSFSTEGQNLPAVPTPVGRQKKSKKQNPQVRKVETTRRETLVKGTTARTKAQPKTQPEKGEEPTLQGPDSLNSRLEKDEWGGCERTGVSGDVKPNACEVSKEAVPQSKSKGKKNKNKVDKSSILIDDVFLPKDLDCKEMDETDREVEYFKRFCLDTAKQTRQKMTVNWTNFSLKKTTSNVAQ
ncbi:protein FAM193B [Discoglossus pictus]